MAEQERIISIHEDWVVVITGFLVILLALIGLNVPVPIYKWNTAGDLTSSVLTLHNLSYIILQFLFVMALAVFSALLVGKPIRSFMYMFGLVFGLSVIALLIAGNKTVFDLNLEAVIFSLAIGLLVGNFLAVPQWLRDH